eukprot:TRINITY_DN30874_c0_g1_i1.p1 TRINITY_DN30874_c0_g1~~TRINITY_DN30874_c0_g1_i1.p1  ORF type:complete len:359 (+),score=75.63 TRINITY_DN30874_c0_g1_i1:201-1277(+)
MLFTKANCRLTVMSTLWMVLFMAVLLPTAQGQCDVSKDFSINYDNNVFFTVSSANGTCMCPNYYAAGRGVFDGGIGSAVKTSTTVVNNNLLVNGTAGLTVAGACGCDRLTGNGSGLTGLESNPALKALFDSLNLQIAALTAQVAKLQNASVPVRSCKELKTLNPSLPDGRYSIQPAAGEIFSVLCDMTTDGGGWTLIHTSTYSVIPRSTAGINEATMDPASGYGKMADYRINLLRSLTTSYANAYMRINVAHSTRRVYTKNHDIAWDSNNDGAAFGGPRQECYATSLAGCTWTAISTTTLDTLVTVSGVGNDCTRVFSLNPCYKTAAAGLCVEGGSTCTINGVTNHPIAQWSTWVRES